MPRPLFSLAVALAFLGANVGCDKSAPTDAAAKEREVAAAASARAKQGKENGEPHAIPGRDKKVYIRLTNRGFDPSDVRAPAGEELVIVFQRAEETLCGSELSVATLDKPLSLPVGKDVEVRVTMPTAGPLTFSCKSMKGSVSPAK